MREGGIAIFTGVRENHAMKTTNALCYMPMLRAPRLEDTLSLNRLKPLTEEADAGEKQSAADAMDDYVNRCALRTCFLLRPYLSLLACFINISTQKHTHTPGLAWFTY